MAKKPLIGSLMVVSGRASRVATRLFRKRNKPQSSAVEAPGT
jgi:hypothetical protein